MEFFEKKMLAKLGFTFDGSELETHQVEAFGIIQGEINKYESDQLKRKR